MHELGHIASHIGHNHRMIGEQFGYYTYDGVAGWNLTSNEWRGAMFEEAFATFLADVALYNWNAPQPHTCVGAVSAACVTNAFDIEVNPGCTGDSSHTVINNIRYLWDVYDGPQDTFMGCHGCSCNPVTDTVGLDQWEFIQNLSVWPVGFGFRDNNGPWIDGTFSGLDDRDARSYAEFHFHFLNTVPMPNRIDTTNEVCMNCLFPH
jgi:hypothetical protein